MTMKTPAIIATRRPLRAEALILDEAGRDAGTKRSAVISAYTVEDTLPDLPCSGSSGRRCTPWLSVLNDRADGRAVATAVGSRPLDRSTVEVLAPGRGATIEDGAGGLTITAPAGRGDRGGRTRDREARR